LSGALLAIAPVFHRLYLRIRKRSEKKKVWEKLEGALHALEKVDKALKSLQECGKAFMTIIESGKGRPNVMLAHKMWLETDKACIAIAELTAAIHKLGNSSSVCRARRDFHERVEDSGQACL